VYHIKVNNKKREVTQKNYREAKEAQSHNPIYKKKLGYFGCFYCHPKKGRKKRFKDLWSLHMHNTRVHPLEDHTKLTVTLAELIMKKVLI